MTNFVRTHGRSPLGERCIADAPAGHWKTVTATGTSGLGARRIDAAGRSPC